MADDIIPLRNSYVLSMVERITELEAEIERLRAAGDALAKVSALDLCDCDNKDCTALRDAVEAWQEARS